MHKLLLLLLIKIMIIMIIRPSARQERQVSEGEVRRGTPTGSKESNIMNIILNVHIIICNITSESYIYSEDLFYTPPPPRGGGV